MVNTSTSASIDLCGLWEICPQTEGVAALAVEQWPNHGHLDEGVSSCPTRYIDHDWRTHDADCPRTNLRVWRRSLRLSGWVQGVVYTIEGLVKKFDERLS